MALMIKDNDAGSLVHTKPIVWPDLDITGPRKEGQDLLLLV
jgi:hypothetical protein